MNKAKTGYRGPGSLEITVPEIDGTETTRLVRSERTQNTIPVTIQTNNKMRKEYRARPPSNGAYACMNARNVIGSKLPAAKLIGIQN
jgi:CheY-like chemotaxis protein